MELHVRFTVDADHCQGALDELGAMLARQERAFLLRWHDRLRSAWLARGLSVVGLAACTVGFGLCAFDVLSAWPNVQRTLSLQMSGVFLIFIVAFETLRRYAGKLSAWTHARALKHAGRRGSLRAVRLVRQARRLVPFEADFCLQGDLLTYSRNRDGRWQHAWHRQLTKFCQHGVALQGHHVIAVFVRPTTLFPSLVVLSNGTDELPRALSALGLRIVRIDAE